MRFIFLLLFLITQNIYFSQNDLQLIFSKTEQNLRQYTQELEIKNISSNIEYISVSNFQLLESDTLTVFQGNYSFVDKDPSSFFSLKDENTRLILGFGLFDEGIYFLRVTSKFSDGHIETYTVN